MNNAYYPRPGAAASPSEGAEEREERRGAAAAVRQLTSEATSSVEPTSKPFTVLRR